MKIYKVGGYVRDKLLGKQPHDTDYVVVGATPELMIKQGFIQVGNSFPVFLHPETKDEYALARIETSTGDGYKDFNFNFSSTITLEEDLRRRDFTINALALDEEDNIIDYFHGQRDLANKEIKHIDDIHFKEDPLRILRACRFSAQLEFTIAPTTIMLCRKMVRLGMLNTLPKERIWNEIEKALHTTNFHLFLKNLELCNALSVVLPEIAKLADVEEPLEYHPEGTTLKHVYLTLQQVKRCKLDNNSIALVNFGLLVHDLGKALTSVEERPKHHNHDINGIQLVEHMCERLKVPNKYREFGKLCCKYHMKFYNYLDMKTNKQYYFVRDITKFKSDTTLHLLQQVHACDFLGRDKIRTHEECTKVKMVCDKQNLIYSIMNNVTLQELPTNVQEQLKQFSGEKFGKLYEEAKLHYCKQKLSDLTKL